MYLYVNATDWQNLLAPTRTDICQMLHDLHFLEEGQDVLPIADYAALIKRLQPYLLQSILLRINPAPLNIKAATPLCQAAQEGMDACSLLRLILWHGEVRETSFLVACQPVI